MRILICGRGYLGVEIENQALSRHWHVDSCTRSGDGGTIACDLGDRESVAHLAGVVTKPDAVIHCASSGRGGAEAYQHVYVNGIKHLAEYFPESLLLFTSSTSVYGQTDGAIVEETSPSIPDRETGKLLLAAELATLDARGIVGRLSGIYGPGRSAILKKFLHGEAVIEEDGRRYFNQIHRSDAAAALLHLIDVAIVQHNDAIRAEIFNISDSQPLSQRQVYQFLADYFQKDLPASAPRDLERKRGWTHKQVSSHKLQRLGWSPQFSSFIDAIPSIAATIL